MTTPHASVPSAKRPRRAWAITVTLLVVAMLTIAILGGAWSRSSRRRTSHVLIPNESPRRIMERLLKNADALADGETIFRQRCTVCHGNNAGGITAPNLSDEYYINVRKLDDFYDIIAHGRIGPDQQQMPPQSGLMTEEDMWLVAAYAASLRGKNLPGKGPEGIRISPWSANGAATAPASTGETSTAPSSSPTARTTPSTVPH